LTLVNPTGALGAVSQAFHTLQMVGSVGQAVDEVAAGNVRAAGPLLLSAALSAARAVGPCAAGSVAGSIFGNAVGNRVASFVATWGTRALLVRGAVEGTANGIDRIRSGDTIGGLLDIAQAAADVYASTRSCFSAEMLLDIEGGKKRADQIQIGDLVWARSEFDPNGALELKEVEEVFVRVAPILNVHVAGQIIRTTAEHPFHVVGLGWIPARMLAIGDLVSARNGLLVPVAGVADSGAVETVYNWRIKDYHTYFVSAQERGLSIWAHNAPYGRVNLNNNNAEAHFGIYEIRVRGALWKIGKADMGRLTQVSGLPTRLHQQLRRLRRRHGQDAVTGVIVQDLGVTTTAQAKVAEDARLQNYFNRTGLIPELNKGSFVPQPNTSTMVRRA
jgi:hypothetical protein